MELQQIKQILDEKGNQIIEGAAEAAREAARREFALIEFELACSKIPDESWDKAEKAVQELRAEKWAKALEKANGDEEKAMDIYEKTYL